MTSTLADLLWITRDDPDLFNSAVLGRADYWSKQVEVCRAVARHKIVVIPSGNSTGKSFLAGGGLIPWWLYTRPDSLALATAPSQTLLGSVLFKEMRASVGKARIRLPGRITRSLRASPQSLTVDDQEWQVIGFSTNSVERASGQHNPNLLALVDEGSGLKDEIWEAIHSWKYRKLVVFGNPLRPTGGFVRLFEQAKAHARKKSIRDADKTVAIVISSTDSPDIHLDESPRGLADASFLRTIEEMYGRDSLYWRTHIELDPQNPFPTSSHEYLLPEPWLDRCALATPRRPGAFGPNGPALAIDISEGTGRDRASFTVGDELGLVIVEFDNRTDCQSAAIRAKQLRGRYGIREDRIVYDAAGPGKDMDRYLSEMGISARSYKGSWSGHSEYGNNRSRQGWKVRRRLDPHRPVPRAAAEDDGAALPGRRSSPQPTRHHPPFSVPFDAPWWAELRGELKALRYRHEGPKIWLEAKEVLAQELGHSPDLADGVLMLFSLFEDF